MTRRLAGSLGLTTVAITGLVFLLLAVRGIASIDGDLRLVSQPQRVVDHQDVRLFEHHCPRLRFESGRT
jgi:hypothetical protein